VNRLGIINVVPAVASEDRPAAEAEEEYALASHQDFSAEVESA
jgi:hypothetical protein